MKWVFDSGCFVRVTVLKINTVTFETMFQKMVFIFLHVTVTVQKNWSAVTVRGLIFEDATTTDRIIYNILLMLTMEMCTQFGG